MPRRDDDIFKKLKNAKPLAKSAGEQEDSAAGGKNTFELMVEKKKAKRKKPVGVRGTYYTPKKRGGRTVVVSKSKAPQKKDLDIFSSKSPDNQKSSAEQRSISDEPQGRRALARPKQAKADDKRSMNRQQVRKDERDLAPKKAADMPSGELAFDAPDATATGQTQPPSKPPVTKQQPTSKPPLTRQPPMSKPPVTRQPPMSKPPLARQQPSEPPVTKRPPISKPPVERQQPSEPVERQQSRSDASIASPIQKAQAKSAQPKVRKVFRHELKYYINYKDYYLLRASIGAVMKLDDNANENRNYHIRSLYFDDIYERALAEKVAGNDDRCKYRIRIYDYQDDVIKLEKKQKHGQYIKKVSMSISRDEYESLIAGDCDFLMNRSSRLAKEVYLKMKTELLRPRVIVDYTREAYVYPIEDVRVTFDMDLKGSTMMSNIFEQSIPCMPMYENGKMVLEVKFNKFLPESIKCALSSAKAMQRSAISKYVLCRKFD